MKCLISIQVHYADYVVVPNSRVYHPLWWGQTLPCPEPYQAGVEDNMVVYISQGRWSTHKRQPICPLEHPVDLPR